MPPVYATISFFSYRFFRSYTYYELVEAIYEALAIAAFLMLLIQFVGESTEEQKKVLAGKSKRKIPIPFCCWRYRPSKPYFMYTLKVSVSCVIAVIYRWRSRQWAVLQYCIFRPLVSIAGVITEVYNVLCKLLSTLCRILSLMPTIRPRSIQHPFCSGVLGFGRVSDLVLLVLHAADMPEALYLLRLRCMPLLYSMLWRGTTSRVGGRSQSSSRSSLSSSSLSVSRTTSLSLYEVTDFPDRSRIPVQRSPKSQCHQSHDLLDCYECCRWFTSVVYMRWGVQDSYAIYV